MQLASGVMRKLFESGLGSTLKPLRSCTGSLYVLLTGDDCFHFLAYISSLISRYTGLRVLSIMVLSDAWSLWTVQTTGFRNHLRWTPDGIHTSSKVPACDTK